jgi:hypothetical protein
MKFDGTNWVNVGNAGFSMTEPITTSLAFHPSGQPYVAYVDYFGVVVQKFNGTSWVNVGSGSISAGDADYISLAFNSAGQPFVGYEDYANASKASVKTFNGTSWVYVGTGAFSAGRAVYTSLAISPAGQPYIAYQDYANLYNTTVMYYNAPAGINEHLFSQVTMYPNPATDKITVETSATLPHTRLSILNMTGQQLITQEVTESITQIDLANLPGGVYFVRISNDKMFVTEKMVKK